jgi:hypothetical protein
MGVLEDHPDATDVRVTFHPQIWHHGRAVTSDDTETYLVPLKQALTPDGELVADDTDGSDQLTRVGNAPDIARNWSGPFYVTVDELVNETEIETGNEHTPR